MSETIQTGDQAAVDEQHAAARPGEETGAEFEPQILALVCERSVSLDDLMAADELQLRDMPSVYVIRYPCSGMIKPATAQLALDEGWDGVVIVGCGVGDCHFREGNLWARERFRGERAPNKFKRMDQNRVALFWRALNENDEFLNECRLFSDRLKQLPPNTRSTDGKGKGKKRAR